MGTGKGRGKMIKFIRKLFLTGMTLVMLSASAFAAGAVAQVDSVTYTEPDSKLVYPMVTGKDRDKAAKVSSAIRKDARIFMERVWLDRLAGGTIKADMSYETKINKADIVSFVVTETTSPEKAAHPTTNVKGYIFSMTEGRQLTFKDFDKVAETVHMADAYSLASINKALTKQLAAKGITPLPGFKGLKDRPSEIYLDSNMHLHALIQPMEVAPYAAGIIDVDLEDK
jgi:hypothetical protein